MTTPVIVSQKLVTESIVQLMEFDFTSIGGSNKVYIANELERTDGVPAKLDVAWNGVPTTFEWIDFTLSSLRSDLTGAVAEPTLTIAAYDLWQISSWSSATSGFSMMDYRGLKLKRQRLFYNTVTLIAPQTYFVKSVDKLTPTEISFTLTPSLGTENGNKPSARKLEI